MSKFDAKIAFPTSDKVTIDEHFGHAKEFIFYSVKDHEVVSSECLTPPPHAPGVIPKFIVAQGATVIITGGMGKMAVDMLKEQGVDVILGASGNLEENLKVFLEGELSSTSSACNHHGHGHGHHH